MSKKNYDYTEKDAQKFARKASKSIVIRSFENGSSKDVRRKATAKEAEQVERAITAALLAIRYGNDEDSARATAEFFILHNSGETHINTYDSVYIPINQFLDQASINLDDVFAGTIPVAKRI